MKAVAAIALGLLLAACGGEEFGDLKSELKDKTKDLRGRIDALPVVKPYEPVPYKAFDQADPFSSAKIELVTKSAGTGGGGGVKPGTNPPKEPPGTYSVEALEKVRVLHEKRGKFWVGQTQAGPDHLQVGQYNRQTFW